MALNEDSCGKLIAEIADELVHSHDLTTSLIAGTNAYGWGYNGYDNFKWKSEDDATKATLYVTISLTGEQKDDAGFLGDEIDVDVKATLTKDKDGDTWSVPEFEILEARRNDE